jgi:hypothetical protein
MEQVAAAISQEVGSTPTSWTCEPLSGKSSLCYNFIPWPANTRNDIRINARIGGVHRDLPPADMAGDVQFAVVVVPRG